MVRIVCALASALGWGFAYAFAWAGFAGFYIGNYLVVRDVIRWTSGALAGL